MYRVGTVYNEMTESFNGSVIFFGNREFYKIKLKKC